ncbi:hypothetical protein VPMG_00023 [Vibrio phage VBP32]|uniref:Uncharacterized protein n=2 Tax=Stoningtonvirus VBP47 TaxID=2846606 RepID=M4T2S1_9CAUD|nr:hypothetical protein VPNG_00105 [Vibrio phage VBP47]YP_007676513.1 hypothetical protein VPMG_00023 [Vibrio phage VBP32]AGH57129.1 hypothetical protein VPNG_00105 [Vibrio phage VBP47]AGH57162.1 hypothetical protein VPMG_00023 [Vibrio phage VBP32]
MASMQKDEGFEDMWERMLNASNYVNSPDLRVTAVKTCVARTIRDYQERCMHIVNPHKKRMYEQRMEFLRQRFNTIEMELLLRERSNS